LNIKTAAAHINFLEKVLDGKLTKPDRIGFEGLVVDLRRELASQKQRQQRALCTGLARKHGKPVFNSGRQIA